MSLIIGWRPCAPALTAREGCRPALLPRKRAAIIVRTVKNYNKEAALKRFPGPLFALADEQLVQASQLIAQAGCLLELEVAGVLVHRCLDAADFRRQSRRIGQQGGV